MKQAGSDQRPVKQRRDGLNNQRDAGRQAHQQQPGGRRAAGEGGEESAHSTDELTGLPVPAKSPERPVSNTLSSA